MSPVVDCRPLQAPVLMGPESEHGKEHPERQQLTAFAARKLSDGERTEIATHLAHCGECRNFLELITPEEGPPTPLALSRKNR